LGAAAFALVLSGCSGAGSRVAGVLLDGTAYELSGAGDDRTVTGVWGVVAVDVASGKSLPLGVHRYGPGTGSSGEGSWDGGVLTVPAGEGMVAIDVSDRVLDVLGPGARDLLATRIAGRSENGLPVLELSPPLRFAGDDEAPSALEVQYGTFAVRRGCGGSPGSVCSPDGAVQAVPLESLVAPGPGPPPPGLAITSRGHRPAGRRGRAARRRRGRREGR